MNILSPTNRKSRTVKTDSVALPAKQTVKPGEMIASRYEVVRCLGRGGMGVVYLVTDRGQGGETRALKVLADGKLCLESKERLTKELRLLRRLRHPGIVQGLEYGSCPKVGDYFTMEYVDWPTLNEVSGKLTVQNIIDVLYELAVVLSFTHSHSVVHYDLKPNNVFIDVEALTTDSADHQPAVKIGDFGMAGVPIDCEEERYGSFIYSAPEMFGQRRADSRTDLYSLGMVGLVLLSGRVPYDVDSRIPLTVQKRQYLPDWKTWESLQVPPELATLITRCLNPDPAFRPGDIAEVLGELTRMTSRPVDGYQNLLFTPFVSRKREMPLLAGKLGDVKRGEQWAVLLSGEAQIGKSRLMDEFAVIEQLKGSRVVRVEGDDVEHLSHLVETEAGASGSEQDQPWDAPKIFRRLADHVTAGSLDHLIVCWHRSDCAGEATVQAFKMVLLQNPRLPIFWILEVNREPEGLKALGFRDHLIRCRLSPLDDQDVAKLVGDFLGHALGYESFARLLTTYMGRNPGQIALGLRQLASKGYLSYEGGHWHILRTDLPDLTDEISSAFQLDLSQLTEAARFTIEWLAVLNEPCDVTDIMETMEFTPEAWTEVITETARLGIMRVTSGRAILHLPMIRDIVYRSMEAERRAQIHQLAGKWLERNEQSDNPTLVAKSVHHYFMANDRQALLRLIEKIIESGKQGRPVTVETEVLQEVMRLPEAALNAEYRYRCRMMLADTLAQKGRYKDAAREYSLLLEDPALMRYADRAPLILKLGQCQALIPELKGAEDNLRQAYLMVKEKDPDAAVRALNSLAYAYYQSGDLKRSAATLERSLALIDNIPNAEQRIANLYSCCRLLTLQRDNERALELLRQIISSANSPWDSHTVAMAHITTIELLIEQTDWRKALDMLDKMERSRPLDRYREFAWRIHHLRALIWIGQGWIEKGLISIEKNIPDMKIYSRPDNYCRHMIDVIRVYYYSGLYWQGMRRIRQAVGVAHRARLVRYQAILEAWAVAYCDMAGKSAVRLARHSESLLIRARHPISSSIAGALLAEHYIGAGDWPAALKLLKRARDISANAAGEVPLELIDLLDAICQTKTGAGDGAHPDFSQWEARGTNIRHPYSLGTFYRRLFGLAGIVGDRRRMQEYHQRALSIFRKAGAHAMVAQCLVEAAAVCKEQGDNAAAIEHATQSDRLYQSLGFPIGSGRHPGFDSILATQMEEDQMAGEKPRPIRELSQIIEMLNAMEEPERLTHRVLEVAREAVGAERGLIIFGRERTSGLSTRAAVRIGAMEEQTISRSIAEMVYKRREPVFCDNALMDEHLNSLDSVRLGNIRTVACLPIVSQGETAGVLYLDFGGLSGHLDDSDRSYLMTLTNLIGLVLAQSEQVRNLKDDVRSLRKQVDRQDGYGEIKGNSKAMRDVFERLALLRKQDLSVLILGETGTGKELVARAIHQESNRATSQFLALNCAAFPDTLVESMLFGHVKGAFSGANSDHIGFFEQANNGTIFLDEVDSMGSAIQGKILRVLQEGEYFRVGDTKVRKCDVRLITAAKPILLEKALTGVFREDLFYRLNVVQILLPPLRERAEDIPILIDYFIEKSRKKLKKSIAGLEPELIAALSAYHWPGNVRQLENAIHQAVMLTPAGNRITIKDLPVEIVGQMPKRALTDGRIKKMADETEVSILREALERCQGDRAQVCQLLRISRSTLYRRMKKHHLH